MNAPENPHPEDEAPADQSPTAESDVLSDLRTAFDRTQKQPHKKPSSGVMEQLKRIGRLGFGTNSRQKERQSDVFEPIVPRNLDASETIEWLVDSGPPYPPFGQFELLGLLGHGTSAFVFKARDTRSGHTVALKVGKSHLLQSPNARARFERESQLSKLLQHPNLIRGLESGEIKRHPYIAFEFCEGSSLAEWADRHPRSLSIEQGAMLVMLLAEAVAHAQTLGVVHRDIKPENVLLDESQPVSGLPFTPKLADFGVATLLHERSLSGSTGSLIGTPQYIPPEQINRRSNDLTSATDVYGLGAVLYFLLVGEPPVGRTDVRTALMRTLLGSITPVRECVPSVPEKLAEICDSCLRRQPQMRCQSARDLADDLKAFIEQRKGKLRLNLVLAKVVHAAIAPRVNLLAMSAVVIAFAATLTACFWLLSALSATQNEVSSIRQLAEADRAEASSTLSKLEASRSELEALNHSLLVDDFENNLRLMQLLIETKQFDAARQRFDVQAEIIARKKQTPNPIPTGLGWMLMSQRLHPSSTTKLVDGNVPQHCVAIAPDTQRVLIAGARGLLRCFAPVSSMQMHANEAVAPVSTANAEQSEVNSLQFSHDGKQFASVGDDGSVAIWDAHELKQLSRHVVQEEHCHHVAFVDNDQRVACSGKRSKVRIVDPKSGSITGEIKHVGEILALDSLRNGSELIVAGSGAIQHWDLANQTLKRSLSGHNDRVSAIAISHDERILVSAGRDQRLCVWDVDLGELLGKCELPAMLTAVAISPSREECVVGAHNGELYVVGLPDAGRTNVERVPELPPRIDAHKAEVYSIKFCADGRSVVTASRDGSACMLKSLLFDVPISRLGAPKERIRRLAQFTAESSDGAENVALVFDKRVELWDAQQWKLKKTWDAKRWQLSGQLIDAAQVSSGMAAISDAGELLVWPEDGDVPIIRRLTIGAPSAYAFHPTAGIAAYQRDAARLNVFDWKLQRTATSIGLSHCQAISWSPDGTNLATATDNAVQIWRWPALKIERTIPIQGAPVWAITLTKQELAFCTDRLQVHSLNSTKSPVISDVTVPTPCSIQYTTGGELSRLLTCDDSAKITIWSRTSGSQLVAHATREPVQQVLQLSSELIYLSESSGQLRRIDLRTSAKSSDSMRHADRKN